MAIGTALGASAGTAAAVGTAALGVGGMAAMQIHQGEQARKAQNHANDAAKIAADKATTEADQAFNRANQKKPNVAGMAADTLAGASAGVGSTLLTGAQGVDPSGLMLGKKTLLGG
jgi:hypothetical protein